MFNRKTDRLNLVLGERRPFSGPAEGPVVFFIQ
jgi:hypothetical protein